MGQNVAGGGGQEGCGRRRIDARCEVGRRSRARDKRAQNRGLPVLAVLDQGAQPACRVGHRRAMAGQKLPPPPPREFIQRGPIIRHIAFGWRDNRGRPSHHMIARQEAVAQAEADVVAHMAGGVDHADCHAAEVQSLAVGDPPVWREGYVTALTAGQALCAKPLHLRAYSSIGVAVSQHFRPGQGHQTGHQAGVIQMGMGDQDGRDRPATQGGQNSRQMGWQVGAGVDHDDLILPQKVGVGPRAGEGARVGG